MDVDSLKPGQEITLVDWGNCVVENIGADKVTAKLNLGGCVKKTSKVSSMVRARC